MNIIPVVLAAATVQIAAAIALVACQVPEDIIDAPGIVIEYPYEYVETTLVISSDEFCMRHVKAALEKPEYIVDMCIIECTNDPTKKWCEDLKKVKLD